MSMDESAPKRNRMSGHPKSSYSSGATTPALLSVLAELKLARKALTTATQSYQASCAKLIATCATPIYQPSQRLTARKILAAVDSELKLIASEVKPLQQIHASLLGARKKLATAMAPVKKLPVEILVNIFALSNPDCYISRGGRDFPNFTSVCSHWRRVALNTPHLWTHVDVGASVPAGLTEALLDRTKDTLIHIHHKGSKRDSDSTRLRCLAGDQIISTLAPHIHRAHTLEFRLHVDSQFNSAALLSLWLQKGTPNLAKSLIVHRPHARLLSFDPSSMDDLGGYSANAQAMMRSLGCLHLENVHFNWDSSIYHGLVKLRLCTPTSVSTLQVVNILPESPALTTLDLDFLTITNSDNEPPSTPIVLSRLQFLSLFGMPSESLNHLLPLLTLTNSSVKVFIGPIDFSGIYSEVENLVIRSHIAELYCFHDYSHVTSKFWPSLLGLPGPLSLILHQFYVGADLDAEEPSPTPSSCPIDVTLSDCWVDPQRLNTIVARSNVESLCLDSQCRTLEYDSDDSEDDDDGIPMSEFNFEEYPNLQAKCFVSKIDIDARRYYCKKSYGC
ncbi:hypothetical protein FRC09_018705 [Ceratobasidium sp. 395]|nr:hypothetical protein FRC09_018705 [Ceratobasidium sp. 395]